MSVLWLTVEVAPGSSIQEAAPEAVALANKTGITIWFDFNGVRCLARAGDNPDMIVADFFAQIRKTDGTYMLAKDRSR